MRRGEAAARFHYAFTPAAPFSLCRRLTPFTPLSQRDLFIDAHDARRSTAIA